MKTKYYLPEGSKLIIRWQLKLAKIARQQKRAGYKIEHALRLNDAMHEHIFRRYFLVPETE